jgi:predicted AAA+ superfamily ATPase
MKQIIDRPRYLTWLGQWEGRDVIKIVTGVRRSGKSTLLSLFRNQLTDRFPTESLISLNLEDPSLSPLLSDHLKLYNHVVSLLQPNTLNHVFIDEAQNADQFERVIDGLFIRPDVDLYITGSSSRLLSGSLATMLSGRYVELHTYPLSYSEYVDYRAPSGGMRPLRDLYDEYVRNGGFPYAVQLSNDSQFFDYLNGIINTVLLKDVVERLNLRNVTQLRSIVEFLFDNVGNLTTPSKVANSLTSAGRPISRQTVETITSGLSNAFLIYPAKRWDVRGKRLLESNEKNYIVDTGLRRTLLGTRPIDAGHILENIVYLELLRRYNHVYVGKIDTKEVDFVVEDPANGAEYIQVSWDVSNPKTLNRELAPLEMIPDHNPRLLLTMDRESPQSYNGIKRQSVLDWLLQG